MTAKKKVTKLAKTLASKLEAIIEEEVFSKTSELQQNKHDLQYLIHRIREELEMAQHCYDNMKAEGLSTGCIEAEGYLRAFKTVDNFIKELETSSSFTIEDR